MTTTRRASETSLPAAAFLLAASLLAAPAGALDAPAPCPAGRFVVQGDLGLGAKVVAIGEGLRPLVSLEGPCADSVVGRRRVKRQVTVVRALFAPCGLTERLRLKVRIPHGCGRLDGRVRVRSAKAARFAALPSVCGDGFVDAAAGEACEDDGTAACSPSCTVQLAPPDAPPTVTPTVRLEVLNKHQYNLIGLTLNGAPVITDATQVVAPGETIVVPDAPADAIVRAELGLTFGAVPLFVLEPVADPAFAGALVVLPTTIAELLTDFSPSRDWSADTISAFSPELHVATFRFAADGSWVLLIDGEPNGRDGQVTLTNWANNATVVAFRLLDQLPETLLAVPFESFTVEGAVYTPRPAPVPPPPPSPAEQPLITGFSPASGRAGDAILIQGERFDRDADGTTWVGQPSYRVEFRPAGGNPFFFRVAAGFEVLSPTELKVVVPANAASGRVVLAAGSNPRTAVFSTSPTDFVVLP